MPSWWSRTPQDFIFLNCCGNELIGVLYLHGDKHRRKASQLAYQGGLGCWALGAERGAICKS